MTEETQNILTYVMLGLLILITVATVFKKEKMAVGTTQFSILGYKVYETKPTTEIPK